MRAFTIGDVVRLYDETAEHTITAKIDGIHDGTIYYALENGRAYSGGLVLVRSAGGLPIGLPPLPVWGVS